MIELLSELAKDSFRNQVKECFTSEFILIVAVFVSVVQLGVDRLHDRSFVRVGLDDDLLRHHDDVADDRRRRRFNVIVFRCGFQFFRLARDRSVWCGPPEFFGRTPATAA